jgi:hypothetical protein
MPYQDDFNAGQKKVNGALVEVDTRVISTLKDILAVIKTIAAIPTVAPHVRGVDFSPLETALNEAKYYSEKVADINPPGCAPPPY